MPGQGWMPTTAFPQLPHRLMIVSLEREMHWGGGEKDRALEKSFASWLPYEAMKVVKEIVKTWDMNLQKRPSVKGSLLLPPRCRGGWAPMVGLALCSDLWLVYAAAAEKMETVYASIRTGWEVSLTPLWTFFRNTYEKLHYLFFSPTIFDSFKPPCFNTCSARYKSIKS